MNQSSVNMVTTYDNYLSFQCLGSLFWWQTKCWMNTHSSDSPPPCNVSPHWACQYATPSIFPATVALWTLAFQNCLCLLMGFGWTVAVYRSHYLTHILVLAKYVKLPLWKMVLYFFSYVFHVRHRGGGGGGTRWAYSARHYSSEGEYKRIYYFHITIWWPSLIFSFYSLGTVGLCSPRTKMIMTLILSWTTFVLRKAKLGLQLASQWMILAWMRFEPGSPQLWTVRTNWSETQGAALWWHYVYYAWHSVVCVAIAPFELF